MREVVKMIKKEITVDVAGGLIKIDGEYVKSVRRYQFSKFTDKGKLSKSESDYTPELAILAEKKLQEVLQAEKEIAVQLPIDQARANELAEIVNAADFDGELTIAKSKYSHSKWYNSQSGQGNMPSYYEMLVPVSVIKEVRELQAIRRKYQNNADFNFYKCNYKTVTNRYADHDNGR